MTDTLQYIQANSKGSYLVTPTMFTWGWSMLGNSNDGMSGAHHLRESSPVWSALTYIPVIKKPL